MRQTRIYIFVFLFLFCFRRPLLVFYKLELGICLITPGTSLKFSPALQNIEAAFKRCSAKVIVQENDVLKSGSSKSVFKNRKALHGN